MFTEIKDVFQNYADAVYEQDVEKFLSGYAPDVHLFDCWSQWAYNGVEEWKPAVAEWFGGLKEQGLQLRVELHDESGSENAEIAYKHCSVHFAAFDSDGQELRRMVNRFSFVLEKMEGSWRIVHEHSSLPISMEDGKAMFG